MKAIWDRHIIAESDRTVVVEGNHYFPPASVHREYLEESSRRTICPWKGEAHYYDLVDGDRRSRNAAWTYPDPKEAASSIRDHVAFWKDVEFSD